MVSDYTKIIYFFGTSFIILAQKADNIIFTITIIIAEICSAIPKEYLPFVAFMEEVFFPVPVFAPENESIYINC